MILSPWLPKKGLAMVFADRGIGKTWVALNVAHAIAGGGFYLGWRAQKPRRVVYIDGEMPADVLQERYASIVTNSEFEAPEDTFRLVAADLQPHGLPDLAANEAQRFYDVVIQDADLIVVDNLSTVCRALRENEADSWGPVQGWCLRQRAQRANRFCSFTTRARAARNAAQAEKRMCLIPSSLCGGRPITTPARARGSRCISPSHAVSLAMTPSHLRHALLMAAGRSATLSQPTATIRYAR
jgi:hypothetical protein